jgi:hypothetical protein
MKGVRSLLLKEILSEVDLLVPNSVNKENKITFINQIQNELFREIHPKTNSYLFRTVPGTEIYKLPDDCSGDNLLEVYVNGNEYQEKGKDDQNHGNLYSIVNDSILIQPTPDAYYESYFYYYARPSQLTIDNLNVSPDIPSDFHELLTIGCAKKTAFIMKDYDAYKVLGDQYTIMSRDVIFKLSPKLEKVKRVRRWS